VHLVDDEHLVACHRRAKLGVRDHIADVVDAGRGRCVHLDDVDMPSFHDGLAVAPWLRHVDGRLMDGLGFVVEGAGENACGRGLADAAHAGEHEAVRDPPRSEGVAQRLHHGFLADQVIERLRPVLARQHDIRLRRHIRRASARRRSAGVRFLLGHPLAPRSSLLARRAQATRWPGASAAPAEGAGSPWRSDQRP
jgi:hypothetical protein